jgi:hypothetical protein
VDTAIDGSVDDLDRLVFSAVMLIDDSLPAETEDGE